ncbi:hypothetical protein GCM10025792_26710 [Pseudonocardia tropica]
MLWYRRETGYVRSGRKPEHGDEPVCHPESMTRPLHPAVINPMNVNPDLRAIPARARRAGYLKQLSRA